MLKVHHNIDFLAVSVSLFICKAVFSKTFSTVLSTSFSSILVDISDMNASLQNVRSTGIILLQDIERVRPAFDKVFSSAGAVDVVDYVKGTVADGDQLGITSKFSAPGKCRRNMLQLKKGVKLLNGVEKETKNIMNFIESQQNVEMKLVGNENLRLNSPCDFSTETPSRHAINNKDDKVQDYDEESVIIPSPVKVDNINMIEKLSTLPQVGLLFFLK